MDIHALPQYLKIALYGRSGTGKTTVAGTAPGPIIFLDVRDKGTDSVRNVLAAKVFLIESWDDIEEAYWYLKENPKGYKTAVLDTVTQLEVMALTKVKGNDSPNTSRNQFGAAAGLMKTWILLYRDLDMTVIFNCQDRQKSNGDDTDDGDLAPEVGPYLMPSVVKVLNAAVGIIGQTFIREAEVKIKGKATRKRIHFSMRLGPNTQFITKIRRDKSLSDIEIPAFIDNPTYQKLHDLTFKE